ncbi:hypothetical protein M0802_012953 [Mischocyttarus mexicanus]|nr:hypothetical protein M0802_012953 [Mischocyttarus mexicanus]
MSSTHSQIIKWSFPAFALIIGLFWYKRRRVDRADPGGINTSNVLETVDKLKSGSSREKIDLSDSGINPNDSYTNIHPQNIEEPIDNCIQDNNCKLNQQVDVSRMYSFLLPVENNLVNQESSQSWIQEIPVSSNIENNSNPGSFHTIASNMNPTNYYNIGSNNNAIVPSSYTNNQIEINNKSNLNETSHKNHQNYIPEEEKENKTLTRKLSEEDPTLYSQENGLLEGSIKDDKSEGSTTTDSGKGGSIEGQLKETATIMIYVYEFTVPSNLVGKLISRHGTFLEQIRSKAGVQIIIKDHPMSRDDKICTIEGSNEGINLALFLIRRKFPEKKYPDFTLEQIIPMAMQGNIIPVIPRLSQLSLCGTINNDISVCYVMKPNRFFLHFPMHPTYPMLIDLDTNMTNAYNSTIPPVADVINRGMILAAPLNDNKWVRVFVEDVDPNGEATLVQLLDHGGYCSYPNSCLRKIRSDFLFLPFQATEVYLANVKPKCGQWNPDAMNVVEQIVSGRLGQAQIACYVGLQTYVNLFFHIPGHGVISVADELIARNYAEPWSYTMPNEIAYIPHGYPGIM